MGPGRLPSPSGAGGNRQLLWSLALTLAVLFVLDLLLPRSIPLLPYYFLVVVLSAGFLTPRQMAPLIAAAYGLAISSGIYWGFFPSIDFITRLVGLSGVTAVALLLSAQRCREVARRRRSEQILNLTLENAASGVGLADAQGRIFRVNPALCAMLGRDAATLQTLSWAEITHPDDIAREHSLVEEMRANRCNSYRLRKRYLRGDGTTIWGDLSVSCARLPDASVDFFIGQVIDVTNEVMAQQQLQRRATTDSLTALLNREEVFNRIQQLTALDQRHGQELAVLFCDLDRFKEVNDTYGHQAGDAVLQTMATRIRTCLRATDLAARVGGDELLVALNGVRDLEGALAIAEKLRQLASEPVPIPAGEVCITASVGVALAMPGESLDALLNRADAAMYAAKQQGRNQVVVITPETGDGAAVPPPSVGEPGP